MRLPLYIVRTGGSKSWFVPYAREFLRDWHPRLIVEPFAGSCIVGLSLLNEGYAERLVLAEKDEDYLAFWRAALGDSNFSYRVAKWTKQALDLPFEQQKPFVEASLERMKEEDPGFWILLHSRTAFNGKKTGGYMTERNRGGILCRWPRTLDASLDLLYSLRKSITVMEDGFDALATFDDENCYAFVDPTYTLTEKCPGHVIYDETDVDHDKLHSVLATRKGAWQLTYNACGAALNPLLKSTATRIDPDGQEEILWTKKGALYGVGVDDDLVKMTSGSGRGGSSKKWEFVLSKQRALSRASEDHELLAEGVSGLPTARISTGTPDANALVKRNFETGQIRILLLRPETYRYICHNTWLTVSEFKAMSKAWGIPRVKEVQDLLCEFQSGKVGGLKKESTFMPIKFKLTPEGAWKEIEMFPPRTVWSQLDEDKLASLKTALFTYYRSWGYPQYRLSDEEKKSELEALLRHDHGSLIRDGVVSQSMHGLGLAWSYHPHHIDVRCNGKRTAREAFGDPSTFCKVIEKRIKYGDCLTDSGMRKQIRIHTGTQVPSNFRPTAAAAIYHQFCPRGGTTWDMSAGYGGRLLGAVGCDHVAKYIGTDPATKTFEGLCRMRDDLHRLMPDRKLDIELHKLGSEEFCPEPQSVDLCFTSPPYFDTEKYSDEPTQSCIKFANREAWLNGFVATTLANCRRAIKPDGKLVLNIANTPAYPNLCDDVIRCAETAGWRLIKTIQLSLSRMMGAKHKGSYKCEPIFVFKR